MVNDDLRITRRLLIPSSELVERFSRSSGPGGQSVNTTDSRVELSFDVAASPSLSEQLRDRALERLAPRLSDGGVLSVAASRERSQLANRKAARERLADLLGEAVAPPSPQRRPTKPSRSARRRRLDTKRRRSQVKQQRRRGDPGEG